MDTTSQGYYSRLFLVPKPDGSFRPIIDLKKLNQFIVVPSFKMEMLFSIIAALQPQEWITKIDLKDAYHHIMVHVNIRKYFRFIVAGIIYQFRVLPFGLIMSHFAPFISSGRLHLRFLQFWFKNQWSQHQPSWDTPIQLDADFLSYLRWFQRPTVMTGIPLHLPEPSLFFFTDASLKGWGASWKDNQISGLWSTPDSQRHINWLELEAIRLALLQWGHQWRHQSVRVYCDNSTAVAYIRKQGGTRSQSLFYKTLELFELLDQFVITLIPTQLPGARNVTADALSRISQPSPTEWRLPTETLNNLFCGFGTPLIDMFATAENKVMPVFVSPYPDDWAWAVDALFLSWDDLGLVYAFPPAPIVPKTLQKIRKSRGTTVILIASQHPSRPWHPLLLQLSTRPRISLQDVQLFQYVPNLRRPQYHRDPRLLDLAAWNLSGTS